MDSLHCQICEGALAKGEAQFVDEETFAFLPKLPGGVVLGSYCVQCFDARIQPEIDAYEEKVALARDVNVYYVSQSKESRFVRRTEKPIKVENCTDRDEVVMRLAFLAVLAGKNSIVDVDLKAEKIRNGGYQTSRWSGRGIPADIYRKE